MGFSTAPVAGNDITAVGVGNIRKDAVIRTETGIAGEILTAYTTTGSITFPTVVVRSGTQWFKANSNGVSLALGFAQDVGLVMTAAGSIGATFTVVLPGSIITTELFPSMAGITTGINLFPSPTTPGGVSGFDGNTMVSYRLLAFAQSATSVDFSPTSNTTLISNSFAFFTSGEALSTGNSAYVSEVDGRIYKVNGATAAAGRPKKTVVVLHNVSGAGLTVRCQLNGTATVLTEGQSAGNLLYPSTTFPGYVTTLRGANFKCIGIATGSGTMIIVDGSKDTNDNLVIESVIAGDVWAARDLLFFNKNTQRYQRADADTPLEGIMEFPAVAVQTQAGGNGTRQLVYKPGSIIHGYGGFGAGDRLYPSSSPGGYSATYNPDLYQRVIGVVLDSDTVELNPQEMLFMAPGLQEKGYFGLGGRRDASFTGSAFSYVGQNFKKTMSNLPSSVVLTDLSGGGWGPALDNVSRFGFNVLVARGTTGTFEAFGTYLTVGN